MLISRYCTVEVVLGQLAWGIYHPLAPPNRQAVLSMQKCRQMGLVPSCSLASSGIVSGFSVASVVTRSGWMKRKMDTPAFMSSMPKGARKLEEGSIGLRIKYRLRVVTHLERERVEVWRWPSCRHRYRSRPSLSHSITPVVEVISRRPVAGNERPRYHLLRD